MTIAAIESNTESSVQDASKKTYTLMEVIETLELTPEQVAELAGVSVTTVNRNLHGSKHASKDVIVESIASALGMNVDEIIWRNGITNQGRMPGSWDEEAKARARNGRYKVTHSVEIRVHTTVQRVCPNPICNIVLPLNSDTCYVC